MRRLVNLYPFMTPRASILCRLPPVPGNGQPFRARHGQIVAYYSGRDEVCANLYWFGDFDPWIDRTLNKLCQPGDIAVDIGANIGATSLVLSRAVGPSGRVFAFEPYPANAAMLRANIQANGITNVSIHELALSNASGTLLMHNIDGHPGMTRISHTGDISVTATRFDDWIATTNIKAIAVCKIDVEGHEIDVLRGMERSIVAKRIQALVFEHHKARGAIFNFLEERGYTVLRIEKSPLRVYYVPYQDPPRARITSDYLAVVGGTRAFL